MILSRHDWHCTIGAVRLVLYNWLCTTGSVQLVLYNWRCTTGIWPQCFRLNTILQDFLEEINSCMLTAAISKSRVYFHCPILSVISFSMLSTFPRLVFTSSIPQYSQISLKTANSYGFLALILFILPFRHIHRVEFRITSSHNLPFSSVLYWI